MAASNRSYSEWTQFPTYDTHLVNTQKIVMGHKLTMRDTIRKQAMKSRGIPRSKIKKQRSADMASAKNPQSVQLVADPTQKYDVRSTIDYQHQLRRSILYRRFQQSRASQRRLDCFSNQTTRPKTSSNINNSSSRYVSSATKTNHTINSRFEKEPKQKSSDRQNSKSIQNRSQSVIYFSSTNIGPKITEYLNLILKKKQLDQHQATLQQLKEINQSLIRRENMYQQMLQQNKCRQKIVNNSFLRQMKKQKNQRVKSNLNIFNSCGSYQPMAALNRKNRQNLRNNELERNHFEHSYTQCCQVELKEQSVANSKLKAQTKSKNNNLTKSTPKVINFKERGVKTAKASIRRLIH